jgi:hypothetical protein
VPGQLVARGQQRSWPTCARSLRIGRGSHDTPRRPFVSTFVQVIKGTNVSDQDSRLQGHRVRTYGRPQPSFALGSSEGTPGTDLCKGLIFSDASSTPGPSGRVAKCVATPQISLTSVRVRQCRNRW